MGTMEHQQAGTGPQDTASGDLKFLSESLEKLRIKLLDFSRRNPLINTSFGGRSNKYIRVVDELPDVLFSRLKGCRSFIISPLPSLETDLPDEKTPEFMKAIAEAKVFDESYSADLERIDPRALVSAEEEAAAERALKDRVRAARGMPIRQTRDHLSLQQHARNHGINPSYDLPTEDQRGQDGRHDDDVIQTLLLQDGLETKANRIITNTKSWMQETGVQVLRMGFGWLEWGKEASGKDFLSPLVTIPVTMERKKTPKGFIYTVVGLDEPADVNWTLAEKLSREHGVTLPKFEEEDDKSSIENFLATVAALKPDGMNWRLRRWIAIGVFPSTNLAMYHDLDPTSSWFAASEPVRQMLGGAPGGDGATLFADEYQVEAPAIEQRLPPLVMDADSSQISALIDVLDGRNLPVEGPPGTGKSQTIVNTIAAAIGSGKKVLFVAEKLAALDVVRSRLDQLGLGPFILPLQSTRGARKQVAASVADRLAAISPQQDDRHYKSTLDDFRRSRHELSRYIELLQCRFEGTDDTVHDMLGHAIRTAGALDGVPADVLRVVDIDPAQVTTAAALKEIRHTATELGKQVARTRANGGPWAGVSSRLSRKFERDRFLKECRDLARTVRALADTDALCKIGLSPPAAAAIRSAVDILRQIADARPQPDPDMLERAREADAETGRQFLERQREWESVTGTIERIAGCSPSSELESELRELDALRQRYHLRSVDTNALWQEFDAAENKLRRQNDAIVMMEDLVVQEPGIAGLPVSVLCEAKEFIRSTDNAVLKMCEILVSGRDADKVLSECNDLKLRKRNLSRIFMEAAFSVSIKDLRESADYLHDSGIFSLFSGKINRAKTRYRKMTRVPSNDWQDAGDNLKQLADWREDAESFSGNQAYMRAFGTQWKGLNTFDSLAEIKEYLHNVKDRFPDNEHAGLRKILQKNPLQLLRSLPEATDFEGGQVFISGIRRHADRERERLGHRRRGIEEVERARQMTSDVLLGDPDGLAPLADQVRHACTLRARLDEDETTERLLGPLFQGARTDPRGLQATIEAMEALQGFEGWSRKVAVLMRNQALARVLDSLQPFAEQVETALGALDRIRDDAGGTERTLPADGDLAAIADMLSSAARDEAGADAWAWQAYYLEALHRVGLGRAMSAVITADQERPERLEEIAEALIYREVSRRIEDRHGADLQRFRGQMLDRLRRDLVEADKTIVNLSASRLIASLLNISHPPSGIDRGRPSDLTQMGLLYHEAQKKTRHVAVRELVRRAGDALQAIKPCWMMSPSAIAANIPPGSVRFDLCIIDEASQMPPENAVGALLRSDQVMVVGDLNQLPPTSFFRKMVDDSDEDDEDAAAVPEESILQLAKAVYRPGRRLRWHYRSRHSGLIQFSNNLIYNNNLIVFPSPAESRPGMGVSLVRIEGGTFRGGVNQLEAEAMVRHAITVMRESPDRSLGMVVMNIKQKELVEELLRIAIENDPDASAYRACWDERDDGLHSLFVKNLENVQGDERDVIMIGTVYGPAAAGGPVPNRFGPINGKAGQRRLNVLLTRAREQTITFSSMTPSDILAGNGRNAGADMLKKWLEYAATGRLDSGTAEPGVPDSPFEEFVAEQVEALGCEAVPQVGVAGFFIDIGVRHPDWRYGYLLGIECDGATWHSARSARDRDRLRQAILEDLGWHLHRIWSTDYFADPRAEGERLRRVIEQRLEAARQGLDGVCVAVTGPDQPISR